MELNLDKATKRYLTSEKLVSGQPVGSFCDLDGDPLGPSSFPIPVYTDLITGKSFGRLVAVMPSNTDDITKSIKAKYLALNPIYVASDDGVMRGWYVPVNDYTLHGKGDSAVGLAESVHA